MAADALASGFTRSSVGMILILEGDLKKNCTILWRFPNEPADKVSVLSQIIAWLWVGYKPLSWTNDDSVSWTCIYHQSSRSTEKRYRTKINICVSINNSVHLLISYTEMVLLVFWWNASDELKEQHFGVSVRLYKRRHLCINAHNLSHMQPSDRYKYGLFATKRCIFCTVGCNCLDTVGFCDNMVSDFFSKLHPIDHWLSARLQ